MILNDILDIESCQFKFQRNDEIEGYGSGQILTAEMATPLWAANVVTPITEFNTGRRIRAILNSLTGPDKRFEIFDPIARYPILDPTGAGLAGRTITVNSVSGGRISLAGFLASYKLSPGDIFQVNWGSSPVRQAIFEVSEDVTAAGTGITPLFSTMPAILPGITTSATVNMIEPKLLARFVPDSIDYARADSETWKMTGFTFDVIQKLS